MTADEERAIQLVKHALACSWFGCIFAVAALAVTPATWWHAIIIFVLVSVSFGLNVSRGFISAIAGPALLVIILWIAGVWPSDETIAAMPKIFAYLAR